MWKWFGKDISWKSSSRPPRYYTPYTARTPWLLAILIAVLACIAVLETGFRSGTRGGDGNDHQDKRWLRRQATNSSVSATLVTSTAQTADASLTTSATTTDATSYYAGPGSYISITTISSSSSPSTLFPPIVASTAGSAYLSITTSTTSSKAISYQSAAGSDHVSITTALTKTVTNTYVSDGQTHTSVSVVGTEQVSAASAAASDYNVISKTDTSSQSGTGDFAAEPRTSFSVFEVTTTLHDASISTQTTSSPVVYSTATNEAKVPGTVSSSQIQIGKTFTNADYFNSSYLAVVIVVLLKMIWAAVFASFKMMEPFYHLSRPVGASVKESLLAEYLSTGYSVAHIQHIFTGHWIMFLATVIYICIGVLAPLAAESMTVISTAFCQTADGGRANCNPVWVLNNDVSRALQAILSLIAVLIAILAFLHWPRKSGIFSNPSSIASMASLISHEETLNDLRLLDQSADKQHLEASLIGNRYTLASYELPAGSGLYRYGLVKTSASSLSSPYTLSQTHNLSQQSRSKYSSLPNPSNINLGTADPITTTTNPFSFSRRLIRDSIFLGVIIALFGVVLAYYLDGSNSGFNLWFNSNTFGPRFILSTAAVVIDFHWKTLEREVRILVPYLRLGEQMAKPESSVLVTISGTPIDALPSALWRGEWFHALIAFTAILSDVLIISVAGVPFSSAQVWDAFIASAYLSLAILGWMIPVVVGVFLWRKRIARLKLPREPDTLLSMWMMMGDEGNAVRKEFDGWETTGKRHRDRACKGRGARYWGGWSKDDNEQWRWIVGVDGGGNVGVI